MDNHHSKQFSAKAIPNSPAAPPSNGGTPPDRRLGRNRRWCNMGGRRLRDEGIQGPQHSAGAISLLPPENELWDVRAAAQYLKRSVSWVYHKAEEGALPVKRIGGWGVRFVPAELRSWVEQQKMKN